jgi:predicted dehydrogenase
MIERQHPAYRAAQEVFGDEDIKRMFNYRSKDLRGNERGQGGGEGSRIIMEDLIHDLSEIEGLTDSQLRNSVVENAEIERWSEVGDFRYNTDVNAEASIQYDDGTEVDMKGRFADEERRYFIAVNEEENKAVYVNTLSSDHISPQAAVVEGQEDVEYLERVAREGLIVDEESQRVLLDVLDADSLEDEMEEHVPDAKYDGDEPQFAYAPVYNQVKQMTSGEEPLSSLEEVLGYQETMEEIYKESGEPDAATPNW